MSSGCDFSKILPNLRDNRKRLIWSGERAHDTTNLRPLNVAKFFPAHKRRRHPRKAISYQMVEETLLDCLNLSRNSNKMKRISHTILQYFTYVVFNQIKNNYYKNLSKMQECGCGKSHRDSTVLYLHRKYSYDFYLRHGGK
ncbi:hypothetical protein HHI36_011814, partial [Cryptolaemus montrouzieri]